MVVRRKVRSVQLGPKDKVTIFPYTVKTRSGPDRLHGNIPFKGTIHLFLVTKEILLGGGGNRESLSDGGVTDSLSRQIGGSQTTCVTPLPLLKE